MLLVPWVIPPAMSTLAYSCGCSTPSLLDCLQLAQRRLEHVRAGPHRLARRDPAGRAFPLILVNVCWFRRAPFFMIMYLASLKSVPEQLYEGGARSTGATWWQRIWYVSLPMMRNIISITVLFSLIVAPSPTSTSCAC